MASTVLAAWATSAAVQMTQRLALTLQSATAPSLTRALLVSWHALAGDTLKGHMAQGSTGQRGAHQERLAGQSREARKGAVRQARSPPGRAERRLLHSEGQHSQPCQAAAGRALGSGRW